MATQLTLSLIPRAFAETEPSRFSFHLSSSHAPSNLMLESLSRQSALRRQQPHIRRCQDPVFYLTFIKTSH